MNNIYKSIKNSSLLFLIIANFFCYNKSEVEYLIICSDGSCESAQDISNIYNYEIEDNNQLATTFVNINDIQAQDDSLNYKIRDYLIEYTNLRFLLLFGSYETIPPIVNNSIPSDDYYTSNSVNYDLFESITDVNTGRIPFNNAVQSKQYVDKLKKYLLESLL